METTTQSAPLRPLSSVSTEIFQFTFRYDPWANPTIAKREYGIEVVNELPAQRFDAVIAAVAHKEFDGMDICTLLKDNHVIFDVKGTLKREMIDARL